MPPIRATILPGILTLIIATAKVVSELLTFGYDWDVDHFMYFGGMLLAGDMQWTSEFDDKLPIVQALFAFPAKMHSIRVWQIMSALAVLLGCVSAYVFVVSAIQDYLPGLHMRVAKTIGFYVSVLIGCSYALLPGGITQINPMAASLAMVAIALADIARRAVRDSQARVYIAFIAGAFSASLAIGIRPYFLWPLVVAGFWAALKVNRQPTGNLAPLTTSTGRLTIAAVSIWGFGWILLIGFFGLAVNAFPYLVIGRLDVLQGGLEMLSQKLIPAGAVSVLKAQASSVLRAPGLYALIFAVWGISTLVMLPLARHEDVWRLKRNTLLDIGYLVILCPLLLEMTILTRHFWPHYLQLFVPFTALGAGFIGAHLIARWFLTFSREQTRLLVLSSMIIISFTAKEDIFGSVDTIMQKHHTHEQAKTLAAFRRYLAAREGNGRDFLNPTGMYFHWQLREPRHGFPHAANTNFIFKGWWNDVEVPDVFQLPKSSEAYCELLESSGPSLVVELGQSAVIGCFLHKADSNYARVNVGTSAANDLWIFERIR